MKKKFLVLIATLVIFAMSFALSGCESSKLSKMVNKKYKANFNDFVGTELTELENAEVIDTYDGLVLLLNGTDSKYTLYNLSIGKFIFYESDKNVSRIFKGVYLMINNDAEKLYDVYTSQGYKFTCTYNAIKNDSITYNDSEYYYDTASRDLIEIKNVLNNSYDISFSTFYANQYIIQITEYKMAVNVFDKNYKFVRKISFNDYIYQDAYINIAVMANGNIVLQTQRKLPEYDNSYTYMVDGFKFELKTYIANVNTGKIREKKINFVFDLFENITNNDNYGDTFNDKYNLFRVYKIHNKQISNYDELLMLDNNLNIVVNTENKIKGLKYIKRLSDDLYLFSSEEKSIIVKNNGRIISEIAVQPLTNIYNYGFIKDGIIYRYEGTRSNIYESPVLMIYGSSFLYKDNEDYCIRRPDGWITVSDYYESYSDFSNGYYVKQNSYGSFNFYNPMSGKAILRDINISSGVSTVHTCEDSLLLKIDLKYYKLIK